MWDIKLTNISSQQVELKRNRRDKSFENSKSEKKDGNNQIPH